MTLSLKYQKIYAGGSGVCEIMHVRLIVDPLLTWRSGYPWIRTWGTEIELEMIEYQDCYKLKLEQWPGLEIGIHFTLLY